MKHLVIGLVWVALSGNWAEAQVSEWGTSGDWHVRIDAAVGNGCYIEKDFESGIRLAFGYLPDLEGGFISAFSADWLERPLDETGNVKFFTSEEKFAGEVEMMVRDGMPGGRAFFNNPAFALEIAKRRSLRVLGPEGGEFEVDLTGSARAIAEMERCQAAQG
ncbi:hypothetical protein [Ruegeria arenilitoris]|uniref:Invasion associated locus B (IalB) protein n=2 Tax=Ruegeria TaxID=97050 RepID=A0A238L0I8_9RHOB|nr:hypothetical protein [Ruegeria arenilitoris]SMX48605.1 hypothetical protein RUA8715_03547 [Ruegeria arenilitoris]